jgi:hypothetical protein
MGWLVIDIIVVYIFKSAVRVFHFFESLKWERSRASFTHWEVVDHGWGCPSVKLHYAFTARGNPSAGSDEIPFYMRWHAKTYSNSLSCSLRPIIRVNPRNQHVSRYFDFDQKG